MKKIALWRGLIYIVVLLCFLAGMSIKGHGQEAESQESKEEEVVSPYLEIVPQTNEWQNWPQGPLVHSEGACLIDMETGEVLYGKNIHQKLYPASTTKILTSLVALENGKLDQMIMYSKEAIASNPWDGTNAGIVEGEILSLQDSLYGIMLVSANEACSGVAENIGGSIGGFVEMMNKKASQLGCLNSHFANPNGLHQEDHYTTPYDLALISREAYKNVHFRQIVGTRHYSIEPTNLNAEKRDLYNTHKILMDTNYQREYCLGGKTGFTDEALNTLVTYAKKDGKALLAVTMHANGAIWAVEDTLQLLEYGFGQFKRQAPSDNQIYTSTQDIRDGYTTWKDNAYDLFFRKKDWRFEIIRKEGFLLPESLSLDNLSVRWQRLEASEGVWIGEYSWNDMSVGKTYLRLLPPDNRRYFSGIRLVPWQTSAYAKVEMEVLLLYGGIMIASLLIFLIAFFLTILASIRRWRVRRKKIHQKEI